MEGNKLEISGRVVAEPPPASYKKISESSQDHQDNFKERPKSLTKSLKSNSEMDGADEQMLPKDEKNIEGKVADVQFINNEKQNGEAKLDIGEVKSQFVGMTKEELMKYANDPFWIRLRWILFVSFWLLWLAMLAGAVIIIIAAPKCAPPTPRTWYEQGPLAEVEPDITEENLKKLQENSVKGVIVAKIDDSYKFANDSHDLIEFIERAKSFDVNVIVELQPLSTSLWLEKSIQKEDKYSDYYIWANYKSNDDSGSPAPPNNWLSRNGSSSWTYSNIRDQFYYAPNGAPHLNFRNQEVIDEFSNVIKQWIDVGAKGIQLKGAPELLVDETFKDEAFSSVPGFVHTDYLFYNHESVTLNVEGIGDVLKNWQKIIREYNNTEGPLLIAEDLHSLDAYKTNETLSFDLPRHSKLFYSQEKLNDALLINQTLTSTFSILKENWPLWQYNYSNSNLANDVMDILIMLLPGCPLISSESELNSNLLQMRSVQSIMFGTFQHQVLANQTVFAYQRVAPGNPGYLVGYNPTQELILVDFTTMSNVSTDVTIQVLSSNYNNFTIPTHKLEQNSKISAKDVPMPPKSAIVLTYVPQSS